jgi:hypothetical protein
MVIFNEETDDKSSDESTLLGNMFMSQDQSFFQKHRLAESQIPEKIITEHDIFVTKTVVSLSFPATSKKSTHTARNPRVSNEAPSRTIQRQYDNRVFTTRALREKKSGRDFRASNWLHPCYVSERLSQIRSLQVPYLVGGLEHKFYFSIYWE